MYFNDVAYPGKYHVPYGPAGDLDYKQLLQLQYLAHKPIIKQPISKYKAPRLLKVLCGKNGHRNSDGRCLCNPEKVVPYIREKINLPPLPSNTELVSEGQDEREEISTEALESEISDIDDLKSEHNKEPDDTKSKSYSTFLKCILSESDKNIDEDSRERVDDLEVQSSGDSDVTDVDDLSFYYESGEKETNTDAAKNVVILKLNLSESDHDSMQEDIQVDTDSESDVPGTKADGTVVPQLEMKTKCNALVISNFSESSYDPEGQDESKEFSNEISESEVADDLKFEYSKKPDDTKSKSRGSFPKSILSESDVSIEEDSLEKVHLPVFQLSAFRLSDDSDVTNIDDLPFYYKSVEKQTNVVPDNNSVIPKLNTLGSDDKNVKEGIQVDTESEFDVTDTKDDATAAPQLDLVAKYDASVIPKLNLSEYSGDQEVSNFQLAEPEVIVIPKLDLEDQDTQEISFQFDEDGSKIWDYGPDESDSEISEETSKRIEEQRRTKQAVHINGVEIPLLELSFLDDDKKRGRSSKTNSDSNAKAKESTAAKEETIAESLKLEAPEYEDDFESWVSETKWKPEISVNGLSSQAYKQRVDTTEEFGIGHNQTADESRGDDSVKTDDTSVTKEAAGCEYEGNFEILRSEIQSEPENGRHKSILAKIYWVAFTLKPIKQ